MMLDNFSDLYLELGTQWNNVVKYSLLEHLEHYNHNLFHKCKVTLTICKVLLKLSKLQQTHSAQTNYS